jgi:hypothetical protein
MIDQIVAHLGRQRSGVIHRLVRGGIDMVDQVAHLVLADGIAHVQAQNVIDRAGQQIRIEVAAQAPHQHKAPPEIDILLPLGHGIGGFDQRIIARLNRAQIGVSAMKRWPSASSSAIWAGER